MHDMTEMRLEDISIGGIKYRKRLIVIEKENESAHEKRDVKY